MWVHPCSIGVVGLILITLLGGCGLRSVETNRHQEDIGFGIVEGTKGYLRMLDNIRYSSDEAMTKVQGQVLRIEGAAYVVQMKNHTQVRLPVDENTRIDRPAHVGDWIEANLDHAGRARIIRNIDDQIILD
jgi:hypothetical protein